jgi:hypothetical protein
MSAAVMQPAIDPDFNAVPPVLQSIDRNLRTIKNIAVFFFVITVISLVVALAAKVLTIGYAVGSQ